MGDLPKSNTWEGGQVGVVVFFRKNRVLWERAIPLRVFLWPLRGSSRFPESLRGDFAVDLGFSTLVTHMGRWVLSQFCPFKKDSLFEFSSFGLPVLLKFKVSPSGNPLSNERMFGNISMDPERWILPSL